MAGSTDADAIDYISGGGFEIGEGRRALLQVGALGTFVAVWWVLALVTPSRLLPHPPAVAEVLVRDVVSGQLFELVAQSLVHYVPGLVIGSALGMALGIAIGYSETVEDTLGTVVQVLRPIPPLAWIPFAIIWFGLNHRGAAFIVSIVAFWITLYNAEGGVEGVDQQLVEVARSLGTDTDLGLVRRVVLPSAAPSLFTGFRTAAGQAWMVIVAAELLGAPGIGAHLWDASLGLSMDAVIAYMLVIGALFLLSDRLIEAVRRRVLAWQ